MTAFRRLAASALTLACTLGAAASAHAATPGINVSAYPDASLALAKGAKQVRLFVRWSDFEPNAASNFTKNGPVGGNANTMTQGLQTAYDTIEAAGATPIMVVIGAPAWAASGKRPRNPDEYASFIGELAEWLSAKREAGQPSPVYEVWNEPDAPLFWGETPDPDFYTTMLKASYRTVKAGDPGATVLTGPTTGNDYAWIDQLYARGAKGSFDGVAVHTDTACSVAGPDTFYRDESGRLGQFTFLGYREVRASMLANGDDKPIWMSELGWTTTNGSPTSCTRGVSAGKKPSGVDEASQAAFLTQAFQCLANDPYVVGADWFTLRDDPSQGDDELRHYGLLRSDGSAKPSLAAFGQAGAQTAGPCGDFAPPAITVTSPVEGQVYDNQLDLSASARDEGVGTARITYAYDGGKQIRNFTDGLAEGRAFGLAPWFGSKSLGLGPHTIEVTALDRNGNTATKVVHVTRVAPGQIPSTLLGTFKLPKKVSCKGRSCSLHGSIPKVGGQSVPGKVKVEWYWKNKQGRFRRLVGGLKPASKPFTFKAKLKKKGTWRVRVVFLGAAPYKPSTSRYLTFKVK